MSSRLSRAVRCALLAGLALLAGAGPAFAQQSPPARDDWMRPGGRPMIFSTDAVCPVGLPGLAGPEGQPRVPHWARSVSQAVEAPPGAPRRVKDEPPPNVSAHAVAVVDEATGELLYGQHPHMPLPPASTTKIMTAIVALERGADLARTFTAAFSASEMVARDGSSVMGMEPGEELSLRLLLYGMLLPSANDGAEQVALSLGGTRQQFLQWMNEKAQELGLRNTQFRSPSGMDTVGHCSSAYDMAMTARYAMQNPVFREIAATDHIVIKDYWLTNYNPLIGSVEGADGVKIGYTDAAGRTIVGSATREGHRVYVSLMHSDDLLGDSTALFNWVFDSFDWA